MKRQRSQLEIARHHLNAWLEAELELTTHQSYKIGSRSLTKADLGQIRKQIGEHGEARRQKPRCSGCPAGFVKAVKRFECA